MIFYKDYLKSTEYKNIIYGDIGYSEVYNDKNVCTRWSHLELSLDIETSRVESNGEYLSFMYIWMVGVNGTAVYGRTWESLANFLHRIKCEIINKHQYTRDSKGIKHKAKVKFFGFIHNISFEWAYIKGNMLEYITDCFLKELRQPLYFDMFDIRFLDSYQITNMSLARLAKTYTHTQKAVGDLDYSVERNSHTKLSDTELGYCSNDVLILNEYQDYYIKTFLDSSIKTMIYTQTGIVRAQLKQQFAYQHQYDKQDITMMYPHTRLEYDMHMTYLFRGGYVHGRADMFGTELTDIDSFDITSAHPFQIVSKTGFPVSEFTEIECDLNTAKDDDKHAYIVDVTFYDIESKTHHSIESSSKCLELKGALIDNGRVHQASVMRVLLTNIDLKIYTKFYNWNEVKVNLVLRADAGRLPRYVVKTVLDAYETKETLKLKGEPYMLEKIFLNSIYGSFVTKIHNKQYEYKNGAITIVEVDYENEIAKKILSPYWGIWTTAYTRLQQAELMYKLNTVYGDTDSVKCIHSESNFKTVHEINARFLQGNKILAERYRKNYELIKELGLWDYEGTYSKFKMLGAKRYISQIDDKINVTCAGLPKKVNIKNPFKDFQNGLSIKKCKLSAVYKDTPYSATVDGEQMYSQSGVSLVPCDFTLSVSTDYIDFINWILKQR